MKHSLKSLPLSNSFAALPEAFYSGVQPTPFEKPAQLIHLNSAAAELLDLDPDVAADNNFANVFNGKQAQPDAEYGTLRRSVAGPGPRHPDQLLLITPGNYT